MVVSDRPKLFLHADRSSPADCHGGPKLPDWAGACQLSYATGLPGRQKGSAAGTNSMGTSGINPLSHSAQYFIPGCSETTWPSTRRAFFRPEAIISCAYSTSSHSRV